MSLILEALKKSEEQRRLGEMPNLGTPITATRRRRSPMPWLAAAVVVAIAAAGGWRYLRHASAPAAGEPAPIKAAVSPEAAAVKTPAAQRQPAKPASPAPAAQTAPAVAATPATPAPTPVAAPKREAAPPPSAPATPPAPPPAALAASVPAAAPAPAPPPSAPAAPAPAPPPAPVANDVPTIDDLPSNVRSALPALPITMQVYSPDPKRRFVIIDGTRVVEGESLRGVTVQEIRPAGLVLEFQGRRVLLPRPGS